MTREDALQHPNWNMGAKITIDSATLMNKGLEFIEAMHLYHMPPEKISIVIHRESIIHSLVEYCDNAVIAQLGTPDMRLPIQYALTWPRRVEGPATPLDLCSCGPLTFAQPDLDTFRCLALALKEARHRRHRRGHLEWSQRGGGVPVPGWNNRVFGHCRPGGAGHGSGQSGPGPHHDPDFRGGPGGPGGRTVRMTRQIHSTTAQEVLCSISF